jgi:membrane-bound ClpP family serine protease
LKPVEASARLIALLWAASWTCVFVYQALEWRGVIPATVAWIALGVAFLLLAVLPWRWELPGGVLLIVCGAGLVVAYAMWPVKIWKPWYNVLIHASLSAPPMLAGFLFVIHRFVEARAEERAVPLR